MNLRDLRLTILWSLFIISAIYKRNFGLDTMVKWEKKNSKHIIVEKQLLLPLKIRKITFFFCSIASAFLSSDKLIMKH